MAKNENEYEQIPQAVMDAAVSQAAAGAQQQPSYAGTFDDQLASLYEQISSRPDFQYDVNADPLYQQHKDQYIQGGKLAMKDTMGQAAALTGGYGSTYGQQVGQQAYDAYLKDMGAVIPELYGMAYDMYRDKGDDLLKQYGLIGDMRDTEYSRYRDALSDWNYQQEVARQQEEVEYNRRQDQEKTAFSRQQQAYANLVALIKASGYTPTDAELQAAGLTREAANALQTEYQRTITPQVSGSSGGGGGGGGGGRGSSYSSQTAEIQKQLNAMGAGLTVDGVWGPKTQAAYDKYMGGGKSGGTSGSGSSAGTGSGKSDEQAYLEYLLSQGYQPSSQIVQSFARAHDLTIPSTSANQNVIPFTANKLDRGSTAKRKVKLN